LKLAKHIYSKKKNKEGFNMYNYIVFTWNPQNKIIIEHWDVELAMILSVFVFQVFAGVWVLACEHPKEKNSNKWWLVIKTFQK